MTEKWIKVEDQMPPYHDDEDCNNEPILMVIQLNKVNTTSPGFCRFGKWFYYDDKPVTIEAGFKITHWMYFPEPPEIN